MAVMQAGPNLELAFAPVRRALTNAEVVSALQHAADMVRRYYGRFPVERELVLVLPAPGDEVHGRTEGSGGASLMLSLGDQLTAAALRKSWVPTHEMVHLAFPNVAPEHLWLAEGLATYVEPLARAAAGNLTPETVWGDLVEGLPQGLPRAGDRGLDDTHTWGRTYWGGALYCLLADVRIHQATGNKRSLGDALRAILAAGGNFTVEWPVERALAAGDAGTGTTVLRDLYRQMAHAPHPVDLPALWKQLGVTVRDGQVHLDDRAPLAAVRRAITRESVKVW